MTDLITSYATRLCLSGAESRRLLDTFRDFGVRHVQLSYYYVQRVFADPLEFQEYTKTFKTVILDSGTIYHRFKTPEAETDFLAEYASYVAALDKKAITAAVYENGTRLEQILPDEAIIYPLEAIRETFDNDLSAVFANLKYVGVSYKEASYKGGENLTPIFSAAARKGAYIHAFGTSSKKLLQKYPFYSANSSSWRTGSRYLNTYIYEGPSRGHRLYQPTDKKDAIKTEKETTVIRRRQENLVKVRQPTIYPQINWGAVYEGDSWEVDKANLSQWLLYIQDLELLVQNKYFLTDAQRQDLLYRKQVLYDNGNNSGAISNRVDSGNYIPRTEITKGDSAMEQDSKEGGEEVDGLNSGTTINSTPSFPSRQLPNTHSSTTPSSSSDSNNRGAQSPLTSNSIDAADITNPQCKERAIDNANASGSSNDTDGNSSGNGARKVGENPDSKGGDIGGGFIEDAEVVAPTPIAKDSTMPTTANKEENPASIQGISVELAPYSPPTERLTPIDDRMRALRQCDFCILAGRCPKYAPGAPCSFGLPPENPTYSVDNLDQHVQEDVADLLAIQKDRIMQAYLEEKTDASGLSRDLGKELERYVQMVQLFSEARDTRDSIEVKAKGHGIIDLFRKQG